MGGNLDLGSYNVKSFELTSEQPTAVSMSQSGIRQARNIGAHVWRIDVDIDFMERSDYQALSSFMISQKGRASSFTVPYITHDAPLGTITGATAYSSTTNDNQIIIDAVGTGTTFKAGDVFTLAGDEKVYMCIEDTTEGVGTDANKMIVKFEPALRKTPANGAAFTYNNVKFTMALDDKKFGIKKNASQVAGLKFSMVEALT
jgi:hypothetical protein